MILHRSGIAKEYLKGWFVLDFISCFPFDALELAVPGDAFSSLKVGPHASDPRYAPPQPRAGSGGFLCTCHLPERMLEFMQTGWTGTGGLGCLYQ